MSSVDELSEGLDPASTDQGLLVCSEAVDSPGGLLDTSDQEVGEGATLGGVEDRDNHCLLASILAVQDNNNTSGFETRGSEGVTVVQASVHCGYMGVSAGSIDDNLRNTRVMGWSWRLICHECEGKPSSFGHRDQSLGNYGMTFRVLA